MRYFDPTERRAGIPEDVAALVVGMTDATTTLSLANISPVNPRKMIIQAGAYAEHQINSVELDGEIIAVNGSFITLELRPSTVSTIVMRLERYTNQPTFSHPWNRA